MSNFRACWCFIFFTCRGNASPFFFKAAFISVILDSVSGEALALHKEIMAFPYVLMVSPSCPIMNKAGIPLMLKILQRPCHVLSLFGIASYGMLLGLVLNSLRSRSVDCKPWHALEVFLESILVAIKGGEDNL
ncbi:hypothetical protein NC651_037945 [Populus alba x Populus x berolinensis]|nr:hypothetical protein NC651_037945 [Populus alba x Populus x berolinensis]